MTLSTTEINIRTYMRYNNMGLFAACETALSLSDGDKVLAKERIKDTVKDVFPCSINCANRQYARACDIIDGMK